MSTVIKAGESGPVLLQLAAVDLADHLREAKAIVAEAKRQASSIERYAQDKAERLFEEARCQGHEEGYRDGRCEGEEAGRREAYEDAMNQFNRSQGQLVKVFEQAVEQIEAQKVNLGIEARHDLVEAAVKLARGLTFGIGRVERQSVVENVRRVVQTVGSKTHITIHVHPNDWEAVNLFSESTLRRVEACESVSVQKDESITPGGCLVRLGGGGEIDATLETQVDELIGVLLGGPEQA